MLQKGIICGVFLEIFLDKIIKSLLTFLTNISQNYATLLVLHNKSTIKSKRPNYVLQRLQSLLVVTTTSCKYNK